MQSEVALRGFLQFPLFPPEFNGWRVTKIHAGNQMRPRPNKVLATSAAAFG